MLFYSNNLFVDCVVVKHSFLAAGYGKTWLTRIRFTLHFDLFSKTIMSTEHVRAKPGVNLNTLQQQ